MNSKNSFTHLSQVNLRVKFLQSTLFTLSAFLTDCNKSLSKVLIFSSVHGHYSKYSFVLKYKAIETAMNCKEAEKNVDSN